MPRYVFKHRNSFTCSAFVTQWQAYPGAQCTALSGWCTDRYFDEWIDRLPGRQICIPFMNNYCALYLVIHPEGHDCNPHRLVKLSLHLKLTLQVKQTLLNTDSNCHYYDTQLLPVALPCRCHQKLNLQSGSDVQGTADHRSTCISGINNIKKQ
jgi:hypothetical protein